LSGDMRLVLRKIQVSCLYVQLVRPLIKLALRGYEISRKLFYPSVVAERVLKLLVKS